MKYISIDLETTGLDPERFRILSIGAIIEDTTDPKSFEEIPKFHVGILQKEVIGSLFAIDMNRDLISTISKYQNAKTEEEKFSIEQKTGMKFLEQDEAIMEFFRFLWDHMMTGLKSREIESLFTGDLPRQIVNGKIYPSPYEGMSITHLNVAGKNFGTFDKLFLEKIPLWNLLFKIRHRIIDPSILFVDWNSDSSLPQLSRCKERAGIKGEVTHNALEDAWDVIQLLRTKYQK